MGTYSIVFLGDCWWVGLEKSDGISVPVLLLLFLFIGYTQSICNFLASFLYVASNDRLISSNKELVSIVVVMYSSSGEISTETHSQ